MKFSELEKEQKQVLILAVGGVIAIFMLIINLFIKPAQAKAEAATLVIDELASKVRNGESILRKDPRVRNEAAKDAQAILDIYEAHLPPMTGRYGWALDNLISLADEASLQASVKETRGLRYIPEKSVDSVNMDSVSMWVPYAVDVEILSNFENLKKFIDLINERFPYCSVAKLNISAREGAPEQHSINLIVEWPVFRFDKDLAALKKQAAGK